MGSSNRAGCDDTAGGMSGCVVFLLFLHGIFVFFHGDGFFQVPESGKIFMACRHGFFYATDKGHWCFHGRSPGMALVGAEEAIEVWVAFRRADSGLSRLLWNHVRLYGERL